jgi:hypothetical protein
MTDVSVGPLSAEEARIRNAADQAYSVLRGEEPPAPSSIDRVVDAIRQAARRAPLRALAAAFVTRRLQLSESSSEISWS